MIVIKEPSDKISKIWGPGKPQTEQPYRLMLYHLRADCDDGAVRLHNVVTGQLVQLSPEEASILPTLPAPYTPEMDELIQARFLVPEDFDEYKQVAQIRAVIRATDVRKAVKNYVILPTTYCNAHCFYCYESDYKHLHMTEETAHQVAEYIASHHEGEKIHMNWFGGEPLVGAKRIDQICTELRDLGIEYSTSMISNGYLMTPETVRKAKELWKLERVQITLDGTHDVYNKTKAYAATPLGDPFEVVLNNIDAMIAADIHVGIRLNLDYYNADDLKLLVRQLIERFGGKKNIGAYVNLLFNDVGFEPVHHSSDERKALARIVLELEEHLEQAGMFQRHYALPALKFNQCMADDVHSVLIQPDGGFCRCEHQSADESYEHVSTAGPGPSMLDGWDETTVKAECPACPVYPNCLHLKKCFSSDEMCSELLLQRLLENYKNKMKDKKYKKRRKQKMNAFDTPAFELVHFEKEDVIVTSSCTCVDCTTCPSGSNNCESVDFD